MNRASVIVALGFALAVTSAVAEDRKDERAGTCADARSQMEYFCDASKGDNDSMVAIGTACTNARKNVEAACEGKVEPDKAYKFDK